MAGARLDEVGYWTELKLEIVRAYGTEYSKILSGPRARKAGIGKYLYVDGFAGYGSHVSRRTGQVIPGSPRIALEIHPPFAEYHFVDLRGERIQALEKLASGRPDVFVYQGDCNHILLETVFPRARYTDRRRALCLLDPYGLDLSWRVVETSGKMGSIDMFLNFPLMDMNRNVLWHDPDRVSPGQAARMDFFWGETSWRVVAYPEEPTLFGPQPRKAPNEVIAKAYRERLQHQAGFAYVPDPLPMRNTKGAIVYYLFFASPNRNGAKIVNYIFEKYKNRGVK